MRNLKRALSLALASVMLVGMMVVGTSAASFPDVTDEQNVEAIEVLNAVEVMIGDNGDFRPDDNVTRNEMAVVMAKLLLGKDADKYVGTHPFTDVPEWAGKYVAACYNEGIVAGRGEGIYDGQATVTAQEAAAMMLRALGYEKLEGTGSDWARPVVAKANNIRLFKDVGSNPTAPMTRNQIAQLSLNTLKATMVTSDIEQDIVVEGVVTIPGKVTYEDVAAKGESYRDAIKSGSADTIELAEKLYDGKLTLTTGGIDDMNRPANVWGYKGETVITSASEPDWTTVVEKRTKTAAELVSDHNSNWKTTVYNHTPGTSGDAGKILTINGKSYEAATATLLVGDVVEVYLDSDNANVVKTIAVTRYSSAKVTGDVATKESGGKLQVRVPGVVSSYTDADKVVGYEDLAKDDIVYYYTDKDGTGTTYIFVADSFEGKLTATKAENGKTPASYTIDGETYYINGNKGTIADVNGTTVFNTLYEYFVDANGYLIDCKKIEDAKSDYVVIEKIVYVKGDGSINGSKRIEAKLVRMDGTTEVVEVNSVKVGTTKYIGTKTGDLTGGAENQDQANGSDKYLVQDRVDSGESLGIVKSVNDKAKKAFFTYSEGSDGYDLEEVVAKSADKITVGQVGNKNANEATDKEIENGSAKMGSNNIPVNNETVFVVAKDASDAKDYVVYTGNSNVPDIILNATDAGVTAYVAKDGIATHVFVGQYQSSSVSGDTIFILSTTPERYAVEKDSKDKDMKVLYYKAIVDGEETEVKVATTNGTSPSITGTLSVGAFEPTYNDEDVITKLSAKKSEAAAYGYTMSSSTLVVNNSAYTAADDTVVYLVDSDLNVTPTTAGELDKDANDEIHLIIKDTDKVDYAVIFAKDDDEIGINITYSGSAVTFNGKTASITGTSGQALAVTAKDSKATVTYATGAVTDPANITTDWANQSPTATTTYSVKVVAADGVTAEIYTITVTI